MTADLERQSPSRTLLILGIGSLAFVLAQTTVIPALGDLQQELGASSAGIAWMVTAYLLVASIATPIFGRLGDMFGKERFMAISLAAFTVGSIVCALSSSLTGMIIGRALQGLGGGVFPLAFGIVRDEFPAERVPSGIAMLGAIAAIGSSIGLPLGGVLVDGPGYHWIFWLAAIMGAAAAVTTHLFVPESPVRTPGRVDFAGAGILSVGLTALLIGLSRGADWGWGSAQTLALLVGGVAVLGGFGWFETRSKAPLVNMTTFTRRPVLTTNIATLLIGSAMISTFVLVPQLVQLPEGSEVGFGLSASEAGLLLVPGGLLMMVIAPIVGKVGERRGSKLPFFVGCVVATIGLVGIALAHDTVLAVIIWSAVVSVGVGATFAAIPNLVVGNVDEHETGEATGVNTIMRNVGSAIGSQIAGVMLAGHVLTTGLPADDGFKYAFLAGAIGSGVAAAAVLLIPAAKPVGAAATQAAAAPSAEPATQRA